MLYINSLIYDELMTSLSSRILYNPKRVLICIYQSSKEFKPIVGPLLSEIQFFTKCFLDIAECLRHSAKQLFLDVHIVLSRQSCSGVLAMASAHIFLLSKGRDERAELVVAFHLQQFKTCEQSCKRSRSHGLKSVNSERAYTKSPSPITGKSRCGRMTSHVFYSITTENRSCTQKRRQIWLLGSSCMNASQLTEFWHGTTDFIMST